MKKAKPNPGAKITTPAEKNSTVPEEKTTYVIEVLGRDDRIRADSTTLAKGSVSLEKLRVEIVSMTNSLGSVLADIVRIGDFQLEEVTFKAEISTSGKLSLLGSGIGLDASGAIELKFCRPKDS